MRCEEYKSTHGEKLGGKEVEGAESGKEKISATEGEEQALEFPPRFHVSGPKT